MYKVKRQSHIKEQLQIEDNGQELILEVDICVDDIMRDYVELGSRLNNLRQALQKERTDELIEAFGRTVTAYFVLFFGEEQTEKLLELYAHRYHEMLLDITPFLQDVVVPRIVEAQSEMKDKYVALAKRGKK